jgi:GTP-sensing pleiotropic transcriptional regulator CodY
MPRERDENSGKYTDAYGDEEFIAAIEQIEGIAGTREIADSVGCSKRQALNRLRELENEGILVSKDVGRSLVWQLGEKDES